MKPRAWKPPTDWTPPPPEQRRRRGASGKTPMSEEEFKRKGAILARRVQYRMLEDEYQSRLRAQGHLCAICVRPFSDNLVPCVDHDHACCKNKPTCGMCTRALLCTGCNTMLGGARDGAVTLQAGIAYLEKYK